jgi:hypothetical protein
MRPLFGPASLKTRYDLGVPAFGIFQRASALVQHLDPQWQSKGIYHSKLNCQLPSRLVA